MKITPRTLFRDVSKAKYPSNVVLAYLYLCTVSKANKTESGLKLRRDEKSMIA